MRRRLEQLRDRVDAALWRAMQSRVTAAIAVVVVAIISVITGLS